MLRHCIRACSPFWVGLIAAAAATGMLFAYDICEDRMLDSLPTVGGCHCWVAGAVGLVLGLLCGAGVAIAQRLLRPILVRLVAALVRLIPVAHPKALHAVLAFAPARVHGTTLLARRLASRAPPFAL